MVITLSVRSSTNISTFSGQEQTLGNMLCLGTRCYHSLPTLGRHLLFSLWLTSAWRQSIYPFLTLPLSLLTKKPQNIYFIGRRFSLSFSRYLLVRCWVASYGDDGDTLCLAGMTSPRKEIGQVQIKNIFAVSKMLYCMYIGTFVTPNWSVIKNGKVISPADSI